MALNKDKIKFVYVECHVQITCVVCHLTFDEFPSYNDDERSGKSFECPKCARKYELTFAVEPKTNEEQIQQTLKNSKIL